MNANRQRANWVLDALLLTGFLVAMLLDLTGLGVHQWLGLAVPALAMYHLARHWAWVAAVGRRFLGKTSASARRNYLIDAGLFAGLATIAVTGLVISTWFDLNLAHYSSWLTVHIIASLASLGLLVAKIALHWRWIVLTARRLVVPAPRPLLPEGAWQPVPVAVKVNRRDFLALMATVGAASLLAGSRALTGVVNAGAETSEASASATTIANGATSAATAACTVACGRRCSYPGHCRRYVDSNGNGKCDLGECGSGGSAAGGSSGLDGATGGFSRPQPGLRGRGGRG